MGNAPLRDLSFFVLAIELRLLLTMIASFFLLFNACLRQSLQVLGICTISCSHQFRTPGGLYIAVITNVLTTCPDLCGFSGVWTSPNGDLGVDMIIDSVGHVLANQASYSWYTDAGIGVGGLCAFNFTGLQIAPTSAGNGEGAFLAYLSTLGATVRSEWGRHYDMMSFVAMF